MLPRLLLLVLLAAAAACGDGGDGAPSDVDAEQVLRVNLPGEPSSLDPQRATDFVSHTVLRNIYSPLLRMGETLELEPAMAREVPTVANGGIFDDGLTYTFRLRDGLKWSDGTPLTARDFVNGAKRLFEPGSGNYYVDFYRVLAAGGFNQQVQEFMRTMNPQNEADLRAFQELESSVVAGLEVSAPDDATVVYRLNRRSPVFLLLASIWPLYPVRQDLIEQHSDSWTEAGNLVTNGPFVLQAWNRGQSLVLTRNPHYYGEAPIIETIEMDVIENGAIAFLAYRKGELDVVVLGPAELVQVRQSTGELRAEFRSYGLLVTAGIFFNTEQEALGDVRVRQALAGALDRDQYAEVVRDGAVLPAYSWLPPGMPGYDEQAGARYRDAGDRSRELLSEAGYPGGAGLKREILAPNSSTSQLTAQWIQEQWARDLGIEVSINTLEAAAYVAAINSGGYQAVVSGWSADYPDPENWLPLFKTGGMLNFGGFSDAEFDRLVTEADRELDYDRRIDLYQQAQRRLLELAPIAPLQHARRNVLVKPWVRSLLTSSMESSVPGDLFFDRVHIKGRC